MKVSKTHDNCEQNRWCTFLMLYHLARVAEQCIKCTAETKKHELVLHTTHRAVNRGKFKREFAPKSEKYSNKNFHKAKADFFSTNSIQQFYSIS